MDPLKNKKEDDNSVQYIVSDVRDADNGYCVYFEDSPTDLDPSDGKKKRLMQITYWLPKSFNFVPKPGDIARFYGVLKLANQGVYGLDFVREQKDDDTNKMRRTRFEMFYTPELEIKETAKPKAVAEDPRDAKIAALQKQLDDLSRGNVKPVVKKTAAKKKAATKPAAISKNG